MRACSRRLCRADQAREAAPGEPVNGSRRWRSASPIRPPRGRRISSPTGTVRVSGASNLPPAARYGATPADQSSRCAGLSCVIPPAGSGHRPSCPPTLMFCRGTYSPDSSAAGRSRSPSPRFVATSASRPSVSGAIAIARTTPILLGLFSFITLITDDILKTRTIVVRSARWYSKETITFSDALAAVRRQLWTDQTFAMSRQDPDPQKSPDAIVDRLIDLACYAA